MREEANTPNGFLTGHNTMNSVSSKARLAAVAPKASKVTTVLPLVATHTGNESPVTATANGWPNSTSQLQQKFWETSQQYSRFFNWNTIRKTLQQDELSRWSALGETSFYTSDAATAAGRKDQEMRFLIRNVDFKLNSSSAPEKPFMRNECSGRRRKNCFLSIRTQDA